MKDATGKQWVVYAVKCSWWDFFDKVSKKSSGLPCCPHCGSVLFLIEEGDWNRGVKEHEAKGHPGYGDMISWTRGKCFGSLSELERDYKESLSELYKESLNES